MNRSQEYEELYDLMLDIKKIKRKFHWENSLNSYKTNNRNDEHPHIPTSVQKEINSVILRFEELEEYMISTPTYFVKSSWMPYIVFLIST